MSRDLDKVNVLITDPFYVTDSLGNPVTGLVNANFTKLLQKDGADSAVTVTITEVTLGRYIAEFTPNATGTWFLLFYHATYNPFGWENTYIVTTDGPLTVSSAQSGLATSVAVSDISSRIPTALVNGEMKSFILDITNNIIKELTFQDNAISDRVLSTDVDTYQAKVWLFDDNAASADRYTVVWFKNSQPILTGITSPTIQVIKGSDGTDLIASTSLTEIGSTGLFKYNETSNRIASGAAYYVKITATIDSATRTWVQQVGRDSS